MSAGKHKPLRQAMPKTAAFVDALRAVFGAPAIDQAIRNGMAGGSDFFASEGGHTIGCQPPPGASFSVDALQLAGFPSTDHGPKRAEQGK